jgi:amino acid permease
MNNIFLNLLLQNANSGVEMADIMRSNGKIYTVLAVILIIVIGLLTYLFFLDKKITKIEKEFQNNSKV